MKLLRFSVFLCFLSACVLPSVQAIPDLEPTTNETISLPFNDEAKIPDYARKSIKRLYDDNIMRGDGEGNFDGERSIFRAEFTKMVVEATGVKKYVALSAFFPDVPTNAWFFVFVETARRLGWVSGHPTGVFLPGDKINRAEIAKILCEAFGLEVEENAGEGWYGKYFAALNRADLLARGTTLENPGAGVHPTRTEVAEQLGRILAYQEAVAAGEDEEEAPEETTVEVEEEEDDIADEEASDETTVESSEEYTPVKSDTEETFEYVDQDGLYQELDSEAGKMYIDKLDLFSQRIYVAPDEKEVPVLKLKIRAEGKITTDAFQLRINGNGTYAMFSQLWAEQDGQRISRYSHPKSELVTIQLLDNVRLHNQQTEITFYANISPLVGSDDAVRVVLFLPDWVAANTDRKIGFFPFSGSDIIVE